MISSSLSSSAATSVKPRTTTDRNDQSSLQRFEWQEKEISSRCIHSFLHIFTREQFCPRDRQAPDCFYYKLLLVIAQSWALVPRLWMWDNSSRTIRLDFLTEGENARWLARRRSTSLQIVTNDTDASAAAVVVVVSGIAIVIRITLTTTTTLTSSQEKERESG